MNIMDKFSLKGKKVYITGSAIGIGRALAHGMAQAGGDIAIVDIDIDEARKTAEDLRQRYNVKTIAVKADVSKPQEVNNMIQEILSNFGTIDVAFNNAGICINENAEDMSFETYQSQINVNLLGVFLTTQAAGRVMIKNKKGSIINTASISGHLVNVPQNQCVYNASKAGVIQLSKSFATEWAKYNVRVNVISPGYMNTGQLTEDPFRKNLLAIWSEKIPMKRIGEPEELQGAALYLASDASTYTTGADILVDGGFTCW
jgi:Dehydrogenases with different specificities (related to short-chain alcohol dehydrogenases)